MNKSNADRKLHLILVDDQYLFLESLKIVIESITTDMEVTATAENGEEAIACLENLTTGSVPAIDAVLMDVRMPVMDGVTASKIIHEKYPSVFIIMLTTFEDDEFVCDAMRNGATGYLLKNIAPEMLVSAVRAVCDGSVIMDPNVAGSLMQSILAVRETGKRVTGKNLPDWFYELSSKERLIIKHILLGKSNKEIAADVHIGEQTVRNYISNIYSKLDVPDRRTLLIRIREVPPSSFY
jgi:DNA-binding NarL/FixJ family response regulator